MRSRQVAALWMLGEYGEQIDESPYVLEPIIDAWGDETSAAVHLEVRPRDPVLIAESHFAWYTDFDHDSEIVLQETWGGAQDAGPPAGSSNSRHQQ